ncbi:MAG TPA: epoxyqueuosine reductase [bacterium]|nr:epoxyqueuosine reductase [bacterium]
MRKTKILLEVIAIRALIQEFITEYAALYPQKQSTDTTWQTPLVSYADAADSMFKELKRLVSFSHAMPADLLPGARSIIAYFLPFEPSIPESNVVGRESSDSWAMAYVETNNLIADLNKALAQELEQQGYKVAVLPATHDFDRVRLISNWSHRHVAYIAGLGKFGLNNMLITAKGCCGRIGTLVTDIPLKATLRPKGEYCLYKVDGSCGVCVDRCVNNALFPELFDRQRCWAMCQENAVRFRHMGPASVCGKCLVGLPCSHANPMASS